MGITQIIKRNGETIQLNTNEPFCFVKEATLTSSLMGDDYISLKIVSSEWLSFAKGDKIVVGGNEYSIRATTTREIVSDGYYNYEPVFYGVMYDLMKTIYRNCDKYGKSDKSTFDLTYTIKEFVQVLIYNLERDYPGVWKFDEDNCPETEAMTIQFSGVNCLQALQTLCNSEQFNLEFQITQDKGIRTIHIGKFGKRINPPSGADFFEWGKGNGLYNLKEQKIDDKAIITRLWVEGGTTNIRSDYRGYAERLQLPMQRMNQYDHTLADGTIVKANSEMIGISDESKRYIENAELRDKIGSEEDVKTYDNIYPKRTGKVTAVVADDICAFVDDTMDFDLNKKNDKGTVYLVDGVSAKITFTSGRLAGQQFELNAKGGYDDKTKTFKIIPFTDSRGLTIPSAETQDAYKIEVGNTYKITDIYLPEQYEKRAEEDLWYAGSDDFKDASQVKAQYALTFDRLYFLQSLSRDTETSVFEVGDYVPVKDTRFGIEKTMRIQKITRNLLLEHDYQITLADSTAISIQTQTVLTVIDHENVINNNRLRDLNKARRGWRTTEDLRNMVYDTDGYFDTENIKPNSIDTNMLTVGAKSQQFVLSGCVLKANFGGNPNMFVATAGILSHLTIDNDKIRSWQMNEASFELQSTGGYYLFAKCSKSGENGVWYLTQEQLKFEPTSDPSNYYFQVGIISSLYSDDNFRDFQTTYGFTRINGNTITTGRIITSDGECFLDLDGNKFRIGDSTSSIDWNVSAKSRLTLKTVSVASVSGDVVPLGVYRGVWNKDYIYYYGDEVSYTDNSGATCTYRYNHATPSKGIVPTNTVYWGIVAQGANGKDGENGKSPSMVYRGVYDSSKTYYGNQYRVDAVKYNGTYYIARIDAGEFYNVAPTNTSKWNNFGAQFESIATNLLLAEGANIGDWFISQGKIVSTLETGNKITLDAKGGEVLLETSYNDYDNIMSEYGNQFGANIRLSLNRGNVEVHAKNSPSYSTGTSYISTTGIFSNMAGTDGMPSSSGYTHRGAIVGLGFANVAKRTWSVNMVDTIIAGVYGRADNSGTAPAFGGFFYNLYAGGLTLGRICITEKGESGHSSYLSSDDSLVIGYSRYAETVYLPSDPKEGQVIFVKQWWSGSLLFKPLTGHHIYDDTSENTDYAFSEGQGGMFVFTIGYVNSVKKEAWIVSRWKF